jgi:REP element-mobilizing transposase RayT
MTIARHKQIKQKKNYQVHVISRAVRRAWLMGEDTETGCNYDHRRQWIVDRISMLVQNFSIEVCAYTVMSNHFHLVLDVRYEISQTWTAQEVVQRWWQLYPPKMMKEETSDDIIAFHLDRQASDEEQVNIWRNRLADLGWFMKCLNEPIALMANKEDGCTGRFWEGRFKSQILLDGAALIACMAYVDLNPIRAKMAETPEKSAYTAIAARIEQQQQPNRDSELTKIVDQVTVPKLVPFAVCQQEVLKKIQQDGGAVCLPIQQHDYFELIDWTGRCIKEGKRGKIPSHLAPILQRLEINQDQWVDGVEHYGRRFYRVVGSLRQLVNETIDQGLCWFRGQQAAKILFQK